jgi:hypothetical protein
MTQTYALTVTRNRGYYGKIRALHIWVLTPRGKQRLGKVSQGKAVTVDVPQDATQIYGKMDWARSEPMDLAFINAGDTVFANLWFTINPLRLIGIPTMPCKFESGPR